MTKDGPVFKKDVDPFEKFRMSICDEIAAAAVDGAKALHSSRIVVRPQDWENFYDLYTANIGDADLARFELARISLDVNHAGCLRIQNREPVAAVRWWTHGRRLKIFGRPVFRVRGFIKNGVSYKTLWLFGMFPIWRKVQRLYHYAKIGFRGLEA